jgi:hypothetical protein
MTAADWPTYAVTYVFDGKEWAINIPAQSPAEASRRLRAIGMTGRVEGEVAEIIPASFGAGIYVRAKTALLNLVRRFSHDRR